LSLGGYLLDSHVLLWLDGEPQRMAKTPVSTLLPRSSVYVSVATAWELGIKFASNKLDLRIAVSKMTAAYGFNELSITFEHAELAAGLPFHHRDPFDRVLVAQALAEGLVLVTSDKKLADYGVSILLV
jgi:PIN domain nuclease of toxin-antitoxin system